MTAPATPFGILVTVALLALYGAYAVWVAISEHSFTSALLAALAIIACISTARLLAWSRFLVYLLTVAFIGTWAYSLYGASKAGYFSLFSTSQIALSLAPETFLAVLACFCAYAVFKQFRASRQQK